jgi:hypothetical protein
VMNIVPGFTAGARLQPSALMPPERPCTAVTSDGYWSCYCQVGVECVTFFGYVWCHTVCSPPCLCIGQVEVVDRGLP